MNARSRGLPACQYCVQSRGVLSLNLHKESHRTTWILCGHIFSRQPLTNPRLVLVYYRSTPEYTREIQPHFFFFRRQNDTKNVKVGNLRPKFESGRGFFAFLFPAFFFFILVLLMTDCCCCCCSCCTIYKRVRFPETFFPSPIFSSP